MTILDHRILIPKSPEKIWEFLSDLSQNANWQVDCNAISFLTSKREGPGTRWRYSTVGGRSYVAEITAWYDGLGYEYTFVDGTPFKESKGRIRLQEIAEGTVVQWTLTYETNGVLGGFRNAVGLKRQMETTMVDSLKNLWKVLQKVMPEDKPREVKSLMRDAPDYESRTNYRPRHPSHKPENQPVSAESSGVSSVIEPPISLEDTRPRAPVQIEVPLTPKTSETHVQPLAVVEPSSSEPELPRLIEEASSILRDPPIVEMPDPFANIATSSLRDELKEESKLTVERLATQEVRTLIPNPDEIVQSLAESVEARIPTPPDTVKMATGEMSVFDLFGIPRPSQTQEMVRVSEIEEVLDKPPSIVYKQQRIGLRLALRRKRAKIRRPT